MSKLSRRSFLKGTAVSALGAAALGMTACGNTAERHRFFGCFSVPASSYSCFQHSCRKARSCDRQAPDFFLSRDTSV